MIFLIDTNVLSEVRKGGRCDRNVAVWYESVDDGDLYVSVLILGASRRGIEPLCRRDALQSAALERWLSRVDADFSDRILPIDRAVAEEWGRLSAVRTIPVADGLLAATARVHGIALATRNAADFTGLGVQVLNPFAADG